MEFKFSCKWFEVSFSGDPGYVETQIQKYEPTIRKVLDRLEKDLDRPAPAPQGGGGGSGGGGQSQSKPQSQQPQRQGDQRNGWKKDSRQKDYGRRGQNRWEDRSREADRNGAGSTQENNARPPKPQVAEDVHAEDTKDSAGSLSSDDVCNALSCEEEEQGEAPYAGQESPQEKEDRDAAAAYIAHEFERRRRAPRIRGEELKKMVDDKRPRTHHDRVMVFGFYMESEGNGSDFTIAEIKRCYRAINQDPGMNIEQVINHATRSGFILSNEQARTIRYKLSNKGRRYVEDGLKLA